MVDVHVPMACPQPAQLQLCRAAALHCGLLPSQKSYQEQYKGLVTAFLALHSRRQRSMIRRNARLRREYLYRKSLEGKERTEYERKRKIREALDGANTYPAASYTRVLPP